MSMSKQVTIRPETVADHARVREVIEAAFRDMPVSDQTEHLLVDRLRRSNVFIPELSLVATLDNVIVGHILLTKIPVVDKEEIHTSLTLAPVSVMPAFQRQGIGRQLIEAAHKKALAMGFTSVILVGHAAYYPRFGYERADKFNITFPFEAPPEACMVIELADGALAQVRGEVRYGPEFFEHDGST